MGIDIAGMAFKGILILVSLPIKSRNMILYLKYVPCHIHTE